MSQLHSPGGTTVQEIHPSMYPVGAEQLVPRPETVSVRDGRHLCTKVGALFRKAYPPAQMGSEEAETMGHAVLTNQFISRLHPELKSKLAGQEGSFDKLLARARFDEAKQREFAAEREQSSSFRSHGWEANGIVAPRTPPKDCTWGHRTGAIGGPISRSHTKKRLTGGTLPSATKRTRAKYGVTCVEQWGMCVGTALP